MLRKYRFIVRTVTEDFYIFVFATSKSEATDLATAAHKDTAGFLHVEYSGVFSI